MKNKFIVFMLGLIMSAHALASEEKEKMYLVQMLNQLEAFKPLIIAASKEQPKNMRLTFHYKDRLLTDIQKIEKGIEERLGVLGTEPRHFAPIKGDYINAN